MGQMTISEIARHAGIRPSAIRYYEQLGILPPPPRTGGQRRYDVAALRRLAVVQGARQAGFTLAEIRSLFYGFRADVPPSARWKALSRKKLTELGALIDDIRTMQCLLRGVKSCRCDALEECGRRILARGLKGGAATPLPKLWGRGRRASGTRPVFQL